MDDSDSDANPKRITNMICLYIEQKGITRISTYDVRAMSYAFFQGDVSEGYVSYLVERTSATEHKFEDESMNWTYETYEVRFMIYRSNYKDIHYVMGNQDAFYTFKDSLITRYDLKSEKIKKRRMDVNEVLGISNQSIYIRNTDGYFKVSLDLKDMESISKSKLPSKYQAKAVEYSFEVEK